MYTLMPSDVFVVSRLFLGNIDSRRNSFAANIFRGHLERGGELISSLDNTRLDNTQVEIRRVVYAAELPTGPGRPNDLTYILFGKGDDLYLAHLIARAPDFDQIIRAEINGQPFALEDLLKGIIVTVPNRPNSAAERLKTGENVDARGQLVGGNQAAPLRLKASTEFYFEEGELKEPPDFKPTALEKAAGFN